MEGQPNINHFWAYVTERYPDARFYFWYHTGELLFYPTGQAEKDHYDRPFSCFRKDGELTIVEEF